ncbi:MAG TPA: PQQ-dependent sugar dehydrogenase [Chitinophaga sp.]
MQRPLFLLACLLALYTTGMSCKKDSKPSNGDENWPADSVRVVAAQLSFPWEIIWGPDNHIWMTERGGRISRIEPKSGDVQELLTIGEVESNGEGGLLGMALHPSFSQQPYVYVVYNYDRNGDYREKVVRYTYGNNTLSNPQVLLDNINASGIHNGSRLLISPDNKLWITTGDASNAQNAQNTAIPNGKVLRINLDGSIPSDNPFSGNPVWSYGHRNPQGLVLVNDKMYASEHGPNIEDEVNIIEKQRNYGWPTVNGPCDEGGETAFCTQHNVKTPIWSSGNSTVATAGMDYYNHDRIPQWSNSLLLTTLKSQRLYQLQLSSDGQGVASSRTWFNNAFGRLRDVCISPAGRVYLCTSNGNNDKVIEISALE